MNIRHGCMAFGVLFVLFGTAGFIQAPQVGAGQVLSTTMAYDLVHILAGTVILAGAFSFPGRAAKVIRITASAYAIFLLLFWFSRVPISGL